MVFFLNLQAQENVNVVFLVFVMTTKNTAIVILATTIGFGMVEKLLRKSICLSDLCILVTLAIHLIERRDDLLSEHLNATEMYCLTILSHLEEMMHFLNYQPLTWDSLVISILSSRPPVKKQ